MKTSEGNSVFLELVGNAGVPVPHELVKYFQTVLRIPEKLRGKTLRVLECTGKEKQMNGIRTFICGTEGVMWELCISPDGEVSPVDLKKGQIPFIAKVYFNWRTGGYSEGKQVTCIPSEHLDKYHGLLYWCMLFTEDCIESAKYYEDGCFFPSQFSWFPEQEDLQI